jgi:hypothetical protein
MGANMKKISQYFFSWENFFKDKKGDFIEKLLYDKHSNLDIKLGEGISINIANIGLYIITLIFTIAFTVVITTDPILTNYSILIKTYLVIVTISWLALSIVKLSTKSFYLFKLLLPLVLIIGPISIFIIGNNIILNTISFWYIFTLWIFFAIWGIWDLAEGWDRFLLVIGSVWTIGFSILSIGFNPIIPFSQPYIADVQSVHILLDFRYSITIVFGLSLLGYSLFKALYVEVPGREAFKCPYEIEPYTDQNLNRKLFLNPIIIIINILGVVVTNFIDIIWQALRTFYFFFLNVGKEFAKNLKSLYTNKDVVSWMATLLITFFLSIT